MLLGLDLVMFHYLSDDLPASKLNVYVHLAYGFDAQKWQQAWKNGKKIGLNEEFPYGYHHAEAFGARVIYSTDHRESALQKSCAMRCG